MSEIEQVRAVSAAYLQAVKGGDPDKAAAIAIIRLSSW